MINIIEFAKIFKRDPFVDGVIDHLKKLIISRKETKNPTLITG
jgi:hypothetical protein